MRLMSDANPCGEARTLQRRATAIPAVGRFAVTLKKNGKITGVLCAVPAAKKKTARPVSRSRRFARTFDERSSHSPRGAAGHNPLRGREWPEEYGIPARYRHSRGASAPCAWNVRIGPRTGFPSRPPLERRSGAPSKTTSARHSRAHQRLSPPRGTLRSLSPSGSGSSPSPNFVPPTFRICALLGKRRNRRQVVDWRDNEDGFAGPL